MRKKIDCGNISINETTCKAKKCIYEKSDIPKEPWCYINKVNYQNEISSSHPEHT